jgi:hypothetical protein
LPCGLAIGIGVAGCGGDGEDEPTLSAATWRERVNAICSDIGPEIRAIPKPTAESEVADFTSAVIPLWDRERHEIRSLSAPPRPPRMWPSWQQPITQRRYRDPHRNAGHTASGRHAAVQKLDAASRGVAALGGPR